MAKSHSPYRLGETTAYEYRGRTAWNKGLSFHTDENKQKISEASKRMWENKRKEKLEDQKDMGL
jgi:hypothetical protein